MEVAFYGCVSCGRIDERRGWIKNIKCPKCGSKKFHPAYLKPLRLWFWMLWHPSYIIQALRGA